MTIQSFTFNPFQTNLYVCHQDGEAVLIDPSSQSQEERDSVLRYIDENGLTVRHLLLTHAHLDHIYDCKCYAEHFGLAWRMHPSDVPLYRAAQEQAQMFGSEIDDVPPPGALLREQDVVEVGGSSWEVRHVPGHSPGSILFYDAAGLFVISGDVLFKGSIGRTDLFMGSMPTLAESIETKLMTLYDRVKVYPGHGPETTIGYERSTNPFLTHGFSSL